MSDQASDPVNEWINDHINTYGPCWVCGGPRDSHMLVTNGAMMLTLLCITLECSEYARPIN